MNFECISLAGKFIALSRGKQIGGRLEKTWKQFYFISDFIPDLFVFVTVSRAIYSSFSFHFELLYIIGTILNVAKTRRRLLQVHL
jgi:hypothetical protein